MNREILFRGKDTIYRKWIYGDLLTCASCTQIWQDSDFGKFPASVIPETVGQFTGLTDKGGKRIFEGDIIAGKIGKFVIRWSEPICGFAAGEGLKMVPCMNQGTMQDYEVIGNIYDNPDLLEVSDNG